MTEGTLFFDALITSLFNDFEETQRCQEPKPVLLPAGDYINTTVSVKKLGRKENWFGKLCCDRL